MRSAGTAVHFGGSIHTRALVPDSGAYLDSADARGANNHHRVVQISVPSMIEGLGNAKHQFPSAARPRRRSPRRI